MSNRRTENPHAIFIPFPLQGHLIPSVLLATKLASKGFTITFVNTESIHHSITKSSSQSTHDVFSDARKSGLDIRYATVSDGLPVSFDRSLNHDQYMESMLHVLSAHVDELVGNLVKSDPSISCLIADTFHVWPLIIAKKYKLVNISFWTEPALILTLYYHLDLLKKNGHYDPLDKCDEVIDYIPGVESIKPTDMMSYLQATNTNTVTHRIIHKALFQDARNADFVVCNTVQELEPHTISAFNEMQHFYAVGPIFSNEFTQELVSTSLWSELDCTGWLDKKPPNSVLYVSFGSYAHISKHELQEIAFGLLQSGVSFVWALRPDIVSSDEINALPLGFEDDVKDRGLIVPWCNQKIVISHPSIGGFLTHCGWNSILESIWCGVPLVCFPLLTDQFTNRKLVVDDWKIGINLCDGNLVVREEVTKKVTHLLMGEKSNELRVQINKVQRTLKDALAIGGSSQRNFDEFVSEVKVKIDQFI
ncbi:UDP-glucuronosyl/UDP-glucosyltransferase [Artemisia annua]|uniref:Glycosyltransferase n=1 Tax=Artemisia annua TaxID=35608 RepID=A0A2U1LC74_ARTAN|nr:UDP-glucuronosyl/UDP-glucosyltransferase [Artemisia annua]